MDLQFKIKHILFWFVVTFGTLLFGLITFGLYSEWWSIAITKNTNAYPWGFVNETPWFYENVETYSTVVLIEAVLLSLGILILLSQIVRMKKTGILYSFLLCFLLLILMISVGAF